MIKSLALRRGQELWEAATVGDLEKVKSLLKSKFIDVNFQDKVLQRTPFYRACGHGHLEVVSYFIQDGRADITLHQGEGGSPIFVASSQNHVEITRLLLAQPQVDVNKPMHNGSVPFTFGCYNGHMEILDLLLNHPKTNINAVATEGSTGLMFACAQRQLEVVKRLLKEPRLLINMQNNLGITAIWFASQSGHLDVVQWMLASVMHEVDITLKSVPELDVWGDMSPKRCAIASGKIEVAELLEQFEREPQKTKWKLRKDLNILGELAAELFALFVFYTDDYLELNSTNIPEKTMRFFQIIKMLNMDLQMVFCNRYFGLSDDLIKCQIREAALKKLAKLY